ncbi:MAG: baeRF12 domain-containing protein [Erythrobacter sp.]
MKIPPKAHVALIDGARFVLLRNRDKAGAPALTSMGEPDLDPTNKSQGQLRHSITTAQNAGNDLDEAAHVAAVADWLNHQVLTHEISDLVIIADKRSLGELRRHYHKALEECLVGEVPKALTSHSLDEIETALAAA